jgi:phospholipid-binding lipoprotein MlaA
VSTIQCALSLILLVVVPVAWAKGDSRDPRDPWEGFNRQVQWFNDDADRYIVRPIAKGYTRVVPRPVRRGVSNVFTNLLYPIVIVNQFLQGKPRDGFSDLGRFILNSTVGLAGLLDPATHVGLPKNDEDFGQTFGVWGAGPGPYLVLPILGPSTVRDGTGSFVGAMMYPWRYAEDERIRWGATVLFAIDVRAGLLDAEDLISGDRYVFLRDAFLQRREFQIRDGNVEDTFLDEDWDDDDSVE